MLNLPLSCVFVQVVFFLASLTGHLDTRNTEGIKTKPNVLVFQFGSRLNKRGVQQRLSKVVVSYCDQLWKKILRYKKYVHCYTSFWPQNWSSHFRFLVELRHEALYRCSCVAIDCFQSFECKYTRCIPNCW